MKASDISSDSRNCNYLVKQSSLSSSITRATEFIYGGIAGKLEYEYDFRNAFIEEGIQSDIFSGDSVKFYYQLPQTLCNEFSLSKNSWIGPIELFLDKNNSSYKLKPYISELEVRSIDSSKIFDIDGLYFSWQNPNEIEVVGYLNLESDMDIAKNIKKEVYLDLQSLDSTALDSRTIESLKRRIDAATLLYDSDSLKYKAYLHRIQNLIYRIDTTHQMKREAAFIINKYLDKHNSNQNIETLEDSFFDNIESNDLKSIDSENEEANYKKREWESSWEQQKLLKEQEEEKRIAEFERQLDLLSTTIQNKQHELDVKQIELDTLCQKGKVQRQVQEQELLKSLNKIIEEHKPLWDSLTYLQKNSQDIVERKPKKVSSFYWTNVSCPDYKNQGTFNAADILNTIGEHASYFNIEPTRLKDSLISLTNSKIPCFTGVTALAAANALASITASGNYNVVSVPAAAFSVYDLFGTVDSKTGEINESQYNLLSFLHNAHNNPEHVFAVILEGMNRCPLESYLDALAAAYYYAKEKPMAVAPVDKISDSQQILIPQIQWPQNVYLIGTLIRGKTTFKIEADYLEWIDLVDAFSLESSYCEPKSHKVRHDDFILKRIEDDIDKFESTLLVGRDKTNITSMHHLLTCSNQDWNREKQHLSQSDLERIEYNRYYIELQEL